MNPNKAVIFGKELEIKDGSDKLRFPRAELYVEGALIARAVIYRVDYTNNLPPRWVCTIEDAQGIIPGTETNCEWYGSSEISAEVAAKDAINLLDESMSCISTILEKV